MLGTVVNALAIVAGGLVGLCCTRGIDDRFRQTVLQGLALCVLLIGAKSALAADNLLVVILSLVVGGVVGEWLAIEARLESLGRWIEARFADGSAGGGDFARGFVSASLVFCVGSMAVVGSLESGLAGNHRTLFAKAMIDGVAALIFASTLGRGVLFASVPVLVYQGAITLADLFVRTAEATGPELTQEAFARTLERMQFSRDYFGSPSYRFTPEDHLGNRHGRLAQIRDGRWVLISDYLE